jgi:hypothetical protein
MSNCISIQNTTYTFDIRTGIALINLCLTRVQSNSYLAWVSQLYTFLHQQLNKKEESFLHRRRCKFTTGYAKFHANFVHKTLGET